MATSCYKAIRQDGQILCTSCQTQSIIVKASVSVRYSRYTNTNNDELNIGSEYSRPPCHILAQCASMWHGGLLMKLSKSLPYRLNKLMELPL